MRSGERTRWPSCKIRIPRSIFTQRRGAAERHDGSLRGSAALRETAFAVAVERLYARGLQLFEQGGELFEVLGSAEEPDVAALAGADPGAGEADHAVRLAEEVEGAGGAGGVGRSVLAPPAEVDRPVFRADGGVHAGAEGLVVQRLDHQLAVTQVAEGLVGVAGASL